MEASAQVKVGVAPDSWGVWFANDPRQTPWTRYLDEATEWVANHLPFEVSAVLSYTDVRRILEWNLEFLRTRGMATPDTPVPDGSIVVGPEEVADFVMSRAKAVDSPYSEDQVAAVLDAQFGYFDAIGAIGPEADDGELD